MDDWTLVYYETPAGRNPVRDFIDGLPPLEAAEIDDELTLFEEFGLNIGRSRIDKLRGELWEFRVKTTVGNQYRVAYVLLSGRRLLLLHAFPKKTRTTPADAIDLGLRRFAEYRSREKL